MELRCCSAGGYTASRHHRAGGSADHAERTATWQQRAIHSDKLGDGPMSQGCRAAKQGPARDEGHGKTGSVRSAASLSTQVAPHSARACVRGLVRMRSDTALERTSMPHTGSLGGRYAALLNTQVAPHSARACVRGLVRMCSDTALERTSMPHAGSLGGSTSGRLLCGLPVCMLAHRDGCACTCSQLCKCTCVQCVGQMAASSRTHARASTNQRALGGRLEGPLGRHLLGKAPPVLPQRWLGPPIQSAQPNQCPVDVGGLFNTLH